MKSPDDYEQRLSKLDPVEAEYRRRMSALTPEERLLRSAQLFEVFYQHRRAKISQEHPGLTNKELVLKLAQELYPDEPIVKYLTESAND